MLQFIIQGRGGQGAQLAGKLMADMFFQEGKHVLVYATYGGARRGTPVSSSLRVDDKPIRMRCDIEHPDTIVCFDPSLLEGGTLLKGATPQTIVLINSSLPAEAFSHLGDFKAVTVDAKSIAQKHQLGRIVNTTLVGAALGLIGYANVKLLEKVVGETSPVKSENNVAACMEGYRLVSEGRF
ncbi:MAG: 2-oxoacid:acceptor oxidoreductase family protein [Desulfuromonadales bacterium]|nr:2-oxoacid:acceptor oxidoreductase family protein [Desulfuromonadales bacterium]